MATIIVSSNAATFAAATAERFTMLVERAIADRGAAFVALTGGGTSRRVYELLADPTKPWRARIRWAHMHLFWSDERHVPPDHQDSNYGLAERALLAHVPIPPEQVHRVPAELPDATAVAREYERAIRMAFRAAGRPDLRFDLILLGIGEDAHIASIFPGSPVLRQDVSGVSIQGVELWEQRGRTPLVAAIWVHHLKAWRITLTPTVLLDSHALLVIASGERKAEAVHAAIDRPLNVSRWPAQLLREAADRTTWMLDEAAAARLAKDSPASVTER